MGKIQISGKIIETKAVALIKMVRYFKLLHFGRKLIDCENPNFHKLLVKSMDHFGKKQLDLSLQTKLILKAY